MNYKEQLSTAMDEVLNELTLLVHKHARENCPVDTGRLRNSIRWQKIGKNQYEVVADTEYAEFVEFMYNNVEAPKTDWAAKRKRMSQNPSTLPFFRPAIFQALNDFEHGRGV